MKQTPSIAVILVSAFILMGGCISGSTNEISNEVHEKKEKKEWFRSENDWIVVSAAVTSSSLDHGVSCEVHLENKSDQTIQHVLVDPWYDLKPRLIDQEGNSAPVTEIGGVRLQEQRESFRRRILHDLLPGESYKWELDLGSTYELQPAAYVLEISVRFRVEEGEDWQRLSLNEVPIRIGTGLK